MKLASPAFANGKPIPTEYTCKGKGISPPLLVSDVPAAAQSLVLYMHDPDAPGGDFIHWAIWNISSTTTTIPEGRTPSGATEGLNDFNKPGYGAPCPPNGTHRYVFELYALNCQLSLQTGAHAYALTAMMQEHLLDKTELIGTVNA